MKVKLRLRGFCRNSGNLFLLFFLVFFICLLCGSVVYQGVVLWFTRGGSVIYQGVVLWFIGFGLGGSLVYRLNPLRFVE